MSAARADAGGFEAAGLSSNSEPARACDDQRVDAHLKTHPNAGVPRATRIAAPRSSERPWALAMLVALVIVAVRESIVIDQVERPGPTGSRFGCRC